MPLLFSLNSSQNDPFSLARPPRSHMAFLFGNVQGQAPFRVDMYAPHQSTPPSPHRRDCHLSGPITTADEEIRGVLKVFLEVSARWLPPYVERINTDRSCRVRPFFHRMFSEML